MLQLYLFIIYSLCTSSSSQQRANKIDEIDTNSKSESNKSEATLTLIGYASDEAPAQNLISFASRYDLDLHLIGLNEEWKGFNDKITGFHSFIASLPNRDNNSFILILDAYDTVPICSAKDLIAIFSTFNSDIVMSTGKDCWPDPNVATFLLSSINESYPYFPWFLCPNSGAIMGRHSAMLVMLERVRELVSFGNGSCADFEGNTFTRNTQSDQRCYTTYFVELIKYNKIGNKYIDDEGVIDISLLDLNKYSDDGITMALDYNNSLFLSLGGMMFMDIDINIKSKYNVSFTSKITNGSSCVLHGNGPGVILWRSFIKQIRNNGNLYIDDYVLRVGVDFFHWILWWLIMPCERLSHWLSINHHFDLGFHSTSFSEQVIWSFHVWTFVAVIVLVAIPLCIWYRYRFIIKYKTNRIHYKNKKKEQQQQSLITKKLVKGLANLDIMVHHNGNTFPLLKTQKNS